MSHISKKLIRLTIMDALDEVLRGETNDRLSKNTQRTIIEAVEKIAENVQTDFNEKTNTVNVRHPAKKQLTTEEDNRVVRSSPRNKKNNEVL